eukprot:1293904-Ditylum_brightwellii.AAC.1
MGLVGCSVGGVPGHVLLVVSSLSWLEEFAALAGGGVLFAPLEVAVPDLPVVAPSDLAETAPLELMRERHSLCAPKVVKRGSWYWFDNGINEVKGGMHGSILG